MPLYFKSKAVEHPVVGLACPTGCLPTTPSASKKSLPWTARSLLDVSALQLPKNPLVWRAVPSAPLSLVGTIPAVNCPLSTVNCPPISSLQSSVCSISPVPAVNCPLSPVNCPPISSLQSSVCSISSVPTVNCPLSTVNCPAPSRLLSIVGFLFAITVAAVEVPAQSQPFTPRLSLDVATSYNDNILLSPTTPLKDFSEVVSPRVGFSYGQLKRTYIRLDYRAALERYFTYEQFNTYKQFTTLDTQAQFDHAKIKLQQSFSDDSSPDSEVYGLSRIQLYTTAVSGEYRLNSKTSSGLDYYQEFHEWLTHGYIDYRQFVVGGTLYYHLLPKTDLLGQFNQGWVEMDRGANALYEELNVGFRGQLTSKIIGIAKIGYQHREFDSSSVSDWNEPVASIELQAQLTDRTTVALKASRTINPSDVYLDRSYLRNKLGFTGSYRLFRTVRLSFGGDYLNAKSSATNIAEDYAREQLKAWVDVTYDLTKWLQLGANYGYVDKNYTILGPAMQNTASLRVCLHY